MKDDYAYSGWLPAGTGRAVQNGAMTPRTSKRGLTGLQPEYLAFRFIQHAGLHLQLLALPEIEVTPRSSSAPKTCTSTSSLLIPTGLCSCPTRAAFDR